MNITAVFFGRRTFGESSLPALRELRAALLLASLVGACAPEPPTEDACAAAAEASDEHEVLAIVLNEFLSAPRRPVVVVRETTSPRGVVDADAVSDAESPLPAAVVDDLFARNESALRLAPDDFAEPLGVEFVESADVPVAIAGQDPWRAFAERYGTDTALRFSRPGIGCDDAVVYVVRDCGDLCAEGLLFTLRRGSVAWGVTARRRAWIS